MPTPKSKPKPRESWIGCGERLERGQSDQHGLFEGEYTYPRGKIGVVTVVMFSWPVDGGTMVSVRDSRQRTMARGCVLPHGWLTCLFVYNPLFVLFELSTWDTTIISGL